MKIGIWGSGFIGDELAESLDRPGIEIVRKKISDKIEKDIPRFVDTEYMVIYNPDKWKYHVFYFIDDLSITSDISSKFNLS